ncbi:MAG: RHS repeat-associated core domain-containing protein, partial [Bacteroidota bacterium]
YAFQKCPSTGYLTFNGNVTKLYYFKDYVEEKKYENFRDGYLKKLETNSNTISFLHDNEYKFLNSTIIKSGDQTRTYSYTYPKLSDPNTALALNHMYDLRLTTSIDGGQGGGSRIDYTYGPNIIVPEKYYTQKTDGEWKLVQELFYDDTNDTYPDRIKENTRPGNLNLTWGTGGKAGLLELMTYYNQIWDYGYNNVRQLESITDHNDMTSTFTYDDLGRLNYSSLNNGRLNNTYTYNYGLIDGGVNEITNQFAGTDGTGYNSVMIYDGLGREVTNTKQNYLDGGGDLVIRTTYDNLGRVKTVNDPTTGGLSKNNYEKSPLNIIEEFQPAGTNKSIYYGHQIEDNNFVVETTDEDGIVTKQFTDIFGRTTKTVNGMGFETTYDYNSRDQILFIHPPGDGSSYSYTYYSDGLLDNKFIPDKGIHSYVYDQYDNIDTETLPNGKVVDYSFHGTYNNFLMTKILDGGTVLEEYIPYTDYHQDFIGEEKYSIHTNFGALGQRYEIINTSVDLDFGRPTHQQITTLDGTMSIELAYDDMGNMLSKNTTVTAFDDVRQSSESWIWPSGIREKLGTFSAGALNGRRYLTYNGNDWMQSKELGDKFQTISYGYNGRGWLNKINSVSSMFGFGSDPCGDVPDIPTPEIDCEKLNELIETFIIRFNCQEMNDGTPTNLEIQINSQSYSTEQVPLGVNSQTINIPLNGATGGENTNLGDSFDFDITNGDELPTIASGIYGVLLDCIQQNPGLLDDLEDLILNGLTDNPIFTYDDFDTPLEPSSGFNTNAPFFGMKIHYEDGNDKLQAAERHNGNISWMEWMVRGEKPHAYGFDYDHNNRLTRALHGEQKEENGCEFEIADHYSVPSIGYDELGNIQVLSRRGLLNPDATTGYLYGIIDALEYTYDGSPNLVSSISDDGEIGKGFKGNNGVFGYDGTGNITSISNKKLGIQYSYHDLPVKLTTDVGEIINYYTSSGIKLKSVLIPFSESMLPKVTNYFENLEFENQKIRAIYFSEGRATYLEDEEYIEYFLKDHLGNTRVRLADKNGDGLVFYDANDPENDEVMSSYHYYPFGLQWDTPKQDENGNSLEESGVQTSYTYNGKEFQDDLGINWHYYGFRMYDPAIARFTSVDPIADQFPHVSGFNYAENEPIANIDLHGLQKVNYRLRGEINLTQGVFGAEAKLLGAKVGGTVKVNARNLASAELGVDSESGGFASANGAENSSTIGVSYGELLGVAVEHTYDRDSKTSSTSLSQNLGILENKDEVVTDSDGNKKTTNTKSIGISGSAGTGFLGIEGGIYLEAVTSTDGASTEEGNALIDSGVQADNTRTTLHVEKLKLPTNPTQIKPQ